MKYVLFTLQEMTPEQLKMNPIRPIILVHPNQELDIDEGKSTKDEEESTKSTGISEQNSTSDTYIETTEESKAIEISQVHSVFNKSTHEKADSPEDKLVTEFELPKRMGSRYWKREQTPIY